MPDEAAGAIVNGRARVKHRFSHTGSITRNVSLDSARDKLLRGHQYGPVSQLSDEHGRNEYWFWVRMLHDPIGVLRTLFYQGESFRYTNAGNRDGWR
jgi:hypothetical protein